MGRQDGQPCDARRLRAGTIRFAWAVAAYLPAHLLLDWVSFIHEVAPLNITPWNPPSGLVLAVLVLGGRSMAPVVWAALVAGDALVRGWPVGAMATLVSDAMIAGIYGGAAWVLRHRLHMAPGLDRLRDLVGLMTVAGLAAALVSGGYVAVFIVTGLFPWSGFWEFAARYWVGEMIGIVVVTPALLLLLTTPRRVVIAALPWRRLAEMAAQLGAIALALWADFGPLASHQYEYFYLLFLPAVWIATRHGLGGAVVTGLVAQIGLIVAIELTGVETARMTHFQLLLLALTATTHLLGAVVSDRRRMETWIRERQTDLAHASRLTEAGEMTAALAHEINQPLTATMSYARAARKIAQRDGVSTQLAEILDKVVAQAERADRVMRSLRDFVRKGEARRQPLNLAELVGECLTLAGPLLRAHGIGLDVDVPADLPPIVGDPVQLQQVMLNLIRNAAEAMAEAKSSRRRLILSAAADQPGFLVVSLQDTGPGLAELVERHLFAPFITTKPSGMGLGLSIARSIVAAHGGELRGRRLPEGGTLFSFTLPQAVRR